MKLLHSQNYCTNSLNIFLDVIQEISKTNNSIANRIIFDVDAKYLKINEQLYFNILFQLIKNALELSEDCFKILISGKKWDDEYEITIRNFGDRFSVNEVFPLIYKRGYDVNKKNNANLKYRIFNSEKIAPKSEARFTIKTKKNEGTVITVIIPAHNAGSDYVQHDSY